MRNIELTHSFHSTLVPGEVPATGAKSLSLARREVLIACATDGRLIGSRFAWHARSRPKPIMRTTVNALHEAGLISVRRLGRSKWAQLTNKGHWYARTLCSAAAGDLPTT